MAMPAHADATDDAKMGLAAAGRGEYGIAIQLYTRAIEAKTLLPSALSATLDNRGMAYHHNGQDDLAIADYDQAIQLGPGNPHAFDNRGNAYYSKGEFGRAIVDYNQSIVLSPTNARAFENRGNAYYSEDHFNVALQDYDQAIALNPNRASAYENRSNAYFMVGRFAEAEADLRTAIKIEPRNAYAAIRLGLAVSRQGKDARRELGGLAPVLDPAVWPGPIVQFYLGQSSPVDVLGAANAAQDPQTRRSRLCEAKFYLGEDALRLHDKATARDLLSQAETICPATFIEAKEAAAELKRLLDQ